MAEAAPEVSAARFFAGYHASGARATDPERADALDAARLGAVDPVTGEIHVPHTAKERLLRAGGVPFDRVRHAALRLEVELLRGDDVVFHAGDAVFVAVESVLPLPVQPTLVCDLTIAGGTPCFVAGRGSVSRAGGFGVHNSAMGKQAMGTYATSFLHRLDGMAHMLHTTQRPLVGTKMSSLLGVDVMTNGINVTVLIASMSHNQEDAVIINKVRAVPAPTTPRLASTGLLLSGLLLSGLLLSGLLLSGLLLTGSLLSVLARMSCAPSCTASRALGGRCPEEHATPCTTVRTF